MGDAGRPLDPALDEVTATPPTAPTYREGVSLWLWDDEGRFGFPRIGVEAVGATWATSFGTALCLGRPGGELLLVTGDHPPLPVADERGRPRVLGAGPLRFTCLEPFERWSVDFDGEVVATDAATLLASGEARVPAEAPRPLVAVELHVDARMVAPPWFQGTHAPEGAFVEGERRAEQLCAVSGRVVVDGVETVFTGGGLRVHRTGGRRGDYGDFHGHVWQSAHFPSGRAFGSIHYHPRPDGSVKYREGWVRDGGVPMPATFEGTPWMTDTRAAGEDVSFTLRTSAGPVRIEGETVLSVLRPPRRTAEETTFPVLQSGIARYRWEDEEAFGMVERSLVTAAPS